jgi:zinc transport system substrate-binding protein
VAEDPGNEQYYRENAEIYLEELDGLIENTTKGLAPHAGERFLVYHPAFGYFADEFGLVQLAIEDEGKEPTPKGLESVIAQARDEGIKVVFVEPQFDRHNAETIADEIDGRVITLDPLAGDYLENMRVVSLELIEAFENG